MVKSAAFLDSVSTTQKQLQQDYGVQAKEHLVRQVMKKELKMRYRKVKVIPGTTNSE